MVLLVWTSPARAGRPGVASLSVRRARAKGPLILQEATPGWPLVPRISCVGVDIHIDADSPASSLQIILLVSTLSCLHSNGRSLGAGEEA